MCVNVSVLINLALLYIHENCAAVVHSLFTVRAIFFLHKSVNGKTYKYIPSEQVAERNYTHSLFYNDLQKSTAYL